MPTFFSDSELGDKYGLSSGAIVGDYAFVAGMALDENIKRSAEAESIADEVRICLGQIEDGLAKAGMTLRNVVKTTCWLSDESYRPEFIEAYREVFAPGPYPARVTLVAGIAGDCRVEIDAIAMKS
jgi:2-iminobutanoate/2-iminopropanoate deaminase